MTHEILKRTSGIVVVGVVIDVRLDCSVLGGDQFSCAPFGGRVIGVSSLDYSLLAESRTNANSPVVLGFCVRGGVPGT